MTMNQTAPELASSLAAKALSQPSTGSATQSRNAGPGKLPLAHMETIWLKMAEMYGHRWTGSFGVSADPDHAWARVLAGLNGRQITNGLMQLVHSGEEWPPSAPAFRAMCLEVPGLPSAVAAWLQALEGRYAHEAVKVAAKMTGEFDLRSARLNDRALQKIFDRNYQVVCRRLQNGEPLDGAIATGIGHDSQKTEAELAQEYAEQQLHKRIEEQGVPSSGAAARAMLLKCVGINRGASMQ